MNTEMERNRGGVRPARPRAPYAVAEPAVNA